MPEAVKKRRAAILLLPPLLLIVACLLLGWGVHDVPGFFRNNARTGLIVVLCASYLAGSLLGIEQNPFRTGKTPGRRWPIVLGAATIPLVLAGISFCDRQNISVFPDEGAIRWTGVVALAIGDAIRLAALRELGRQYSMFLTIQSQHQLIRTGPYRHIRHPFYLGGLLTIPGMMLALRSPLSIIVFVISAAFIATRIGREEKMLLDQFPEEYAQYRRHSWRLLPYVF